MSVDGSNYHRTGNPHAVLEKLDYRDDLYCLADPPIQVRLMVANPLIEPHSMEFRMSFALFWKQTALK